MLLRSEKRIELIGKCVYLTRNRCLQSISNICLIELSTLIAFLLGYTCFFEFLNKLSNIYNCQYKFYSRPHSICKNPVLYQNSLCLNNAINIFSTKMSIVIETDRLSDKDNLFPPLTKIKTIN